VEHSMRPFLRWFMTRQLKRQCREACAISYVTKGVLQQRYPPNTQALSTVYSSIELGDEGFIEAPRHFSSVPSPIRVISVGTLEVLYKGFDVLIDAVAIAINKGLSIHLTIVGDGRCRSELEKRVQGCGIESRVNFTGRVASGEAIRRELDSADLFVLASTAEGLPRAMIEAMARGLPCIGTAVGGIPELLATNDLVARSNALALAIKIAEVATNPERMSQMSKANLSKALDYHDSVLRGRRHSFLGHVQRTTQKWNQKFGKPGVSPKTARDASYSG
jgi:glycosyltransferase involved in cell wall biosynthesis